MTGITKPHTNSGSKTIPMNNSISFTTGEVRTYYSERVPGLVQMPSDKLRGPCPIHEGKDNNFEVDSKTGLWFCHSQCGNGGDIIRLEMRLTGEDFTVAKSHV